MVKNIPAMCKTQLQSLGQEDPLEKNTLVFLPGQSHGQRSLGGGRALPSIRLQILGHT